MNPEPAPPGGRTLAAMHSHLLTAMNSSLRDFGKLCHGRWHKRADGSGVVLPHVGRPALLMRPAAAWSLCVMAGLLFGLGVANAAVKTPRKPVVHEYHGVQVLDEYQWLENADDPAVRRWIEAQNKHTRATLDKLPMRPWIRDRLQRLFSGGMTNYFALSWRRGQLFLLKQTTPSEQPVLVTLGSITNLSSERVILNPNNSSANEAAMIDWYVPSPDGKMVAVELSGSGTRDGALYFYETETGRRLPDIVPTVRVTSGGSAAWNADATGIYYVGYPRNGDRPDAEGGMRQQVYFHKIGTTVEQDLRELGRELPRLAKIQLQRSPDGRHILASV
ncbi:MAG: hypothetical protein L0Z50_14755, partial [Verrucomicrobiales bacterium]|nr:hypothetical protein [Verrucomicrobiales bacterium]